MNNVLKYKIIFGIVVSLISVFVAQMIFYPVHTCACLRKTNLSKPIIDSYYEGKLPVFKLPYVFISSIIPSCPDVCENNNLYFCTDNRTKMENQLMIECENESLIYSLGLSK